MWGMEGKTVIRGDNNQPEFGTIIVTITGIPEEFHNPDLWIRMAFRMEYNLQGISLDQTITGIESSATFTLEMIPLATIPASAFPIGVFFGVSFERILLNGDIGVSGESFPQQINLGNNYFSWADFPWT